MKKKEKIKKRDNRTKEIKVQEEKDKVPGSSFNLHIDAAKKPNETTNKVHKLHKVKESKKKPTKRHFKKNTSQNKQRKSSVGRRIWNFLEWVAVSGVIFAILFFAMNFSAYEMLLKSKLEKVTGSFKLNPYIEEMLGGEENIEQELLPSQGTHAESSQSIPALSLDITPPDDRIIIPRINRNVPVIGVSTENLIKRDWDALESEIQDALKYGVVHYPGTANAGETGNVVITGHSSYFAWDPGRFKDVFALLHQVVVNDTIIVYHEQEKVTYEVYETKIVEPDQVHVLTQSGEDRLTLITCTPVGTNLRRLIVLAKPIR